MFCLLFEKGFLTVTLQAFLDEKSQERVFLGLGRKEGWEEGVCFVFASTLLGGFK